jgi:ketosteroid isomerase-like protein
VTLTGAVARYIDAWNDHDARACAECFAPDGVRAWRILPPPTISGDPFPRFVGRDAIEERIAGLMGAIADLRVEVTALSEGSDERVWTEWRLTGRRGADGPDGAPGEPVELVGVSIFRVASGRIAEERAYWDTMLMPWPRQGAVA